MKRGKKYKQAAEKLTQGTVQSYREAVDLVKSLAFAKFDETVELSIKLNLKKSQNVRDTLVLPHQFGAEKKILVFAKDDQAREAQEAGAAYVGAEDLVEKIKGGWLDFDVAVATPDLMKSVGRLGQILGRRGLMPNPKTGTVSSNVKHTLAELKKGRVEYRSDKTGVVNFAVGKVSMEPNKLLENITEIVKAVIAKKPTEVKGDFLRGVCLSSTMGPGVRVNHKEKIA